MVKKKHKKDEKTEKINTIPPSEVNLPSLPSKLQLKPLKKDQNPTITKTRKKVQPDRTNQRSISSIFKKIVPESEPGGDEQLPQLDPQRDDQNQTRAHRQDVTSSNISLRGEDLIPVQTSAINS